MIHRLLLVLGLLLCAVESRAQTPIEIMSRKQLFVDKRFIAAGERTELKMNPAQKLGLTLDEKGQPSVESGHPSRVMEDNDRIPARWAQRSWNCATPGGGHRNAILSG